MFENGDDVLETVLKFYGRTKESFLEDVKILREWIQSQPHLPEVMGERSIGNFFLLGKCSIEKAKRLMDNYYTIRGLMPEMYLNPESPEVQDLEKICWIVALPKRTKESYSVGTSKLADMARGRQFEPFAYAAMALAIYEVRLQEDVMFADVLILDMEGVPASAILKLTPSFFQKVFTIFQKVFSFRIIAIHITNAPSAFERILAVIKTIVKPKIFQRIHVHTDANVWKQFPKEMVPEDFGGEEKSLKELQEIRREKVLGYRKRFQELENMKVNEELRPKDLKNDELLGFYGNFKKLDVD